MNMTPVRWPVRAALISLTALSLACSSTPGADTKTEVARGGETVLTAGELIEELELEPAFMRKRFNEDAQTKKSYVERVLRDKALLEEARRRKLDEDPQLRRRFDRMLIERLTELLRKEISEQTVTEAEVAEYVEKHRSTLEPEVLVRVSQILLGSKKEAEDLVAEVSAASDRVASFRAAAEKRSLDELTRRRGGDLGFVSARRGGLEPAIIQAALSLKKSGDLSSVIELKGRWAVLIRTQDPPPSSFSPETAKRMARQRLLLDRRTRAPELLVEKLYGGQKPELDQSAIEAVKVPED